MSGKELLGFVGSGITGFVVAFLVMLLLGLTWREAMPASIVTAVGVPPVVFFYSRYQPKES